VRTSDFRNLEALHHSSYDLVITDLGRRTSSEQSSLAGLKGLQLVLKAGGPPVIVYAGYNAIRLRDAVIRHGGLGSTKYPKELYALIEKALGRTVPSDVDLER
jgi:hypothetical protein